MMLSFVVVAMSVASARAADPLLRVTLSNKCVEGKTLAHDDYGCWLAARDGRTTWVDFSDVKKFETVDDRFRSYSRADMRDRLRRRFDGEYEVASAGEYLVAARNGRAQAYAELFDHVYRSFVGYFSQRGFSIDRPEFPLVAIVFKTRGEFAEFCQAEGRSRVDGFVGFYFGRANCVVLYDEGSTLSDAGKLHRTAPMGVGGLFDHGGHHAATALMDVGHSQCVARIEGNLRDTIVHEAIHQVGYNAGLHTRIGQNPKWVVEGLATLFEPDGVRARTSSRHLRDRTNLGQYLAFMNYARRSRPGADSLHSLVTRDERFLKQVNAAYAECWALTFFLTETRRPEYTRFLKTIVHRDPMSVYTPKQRLDDFQSAFGSDVDRLDRQFIEFMDDVQSSVEHGR